MTNRVRGTWIAAGLMTALAFAAWAQGKGGTARPAAPSEAVVARVGGGVITRAAFDQRMREAEDSYKERSSAPIPAEFRPMLRRQVLEGLIRERLLALEARRRGMTLTEAQAVEELKKDPFFQTGGQFDEAKFLAIRTTQPEQFRRVLADLQQNLPARRLKEQVDRESRPDEAALRADLERRLSRVSIEFLALRRAAFSAENPEPSEREVLEYYRTHAAEFPRPEQVNLTVVTVNLPPLPDLGKETPSGVQEWESRMRQRADSLLGALKGGAKVEDLAPRFGTLGSEVVERDRFPATWRASARVKQAVFGAAPGTWIPETIPGQGGFLVARVDQHLPPHAAALREVTGTIRTRLRDEATRRRDDAELKALYDAVRDSLTGPAYRIRYAVADTAAVRVAEPSAAEIDRYYRGHLADYSFFDAKTGSVGAKSLSEVRGEVRARLLQERRLSAARSAAEQLLATWQAKKRDAKLERAMTAIREVGPIPRGAVVDTGWAGQALSDSLTGMMARVGWVRDRRGWVVYDVFEQVPRFTPSLEQARPLLAARLAPKLQQQIEEGARRIYEREPQRLEAGKLIRFTRLMVNPPEITTVSLSREEVESYYKTHLEDYGAPELARVRHILITPADPGPKADAEARAKAEDLMRRIKAGARFEDLAKQYSDDEATRDKGGDVGVFRHGMMLDEFERVAFTMEPGDLRGPVKTEVGYHIMECLEHVPAEVTPLKYAYGNVGSDLSHDKADRIARYRADSLLRVLKTPAQALRVAERMGLTVYHNEQPVSATTPVPYLKGYFERINDLKPGQFDSMPQEYRGQGYAITWVDSIVTAQRPTWEMVRDQAIEIYKRDLVQSRLEAKRAEMDSLLHSGWSFDSLSALFGGFEHHGPMGPGSGLERLAGRELLDSLAFGSGTRPPVLQPGKVVGWVRFPAGLVMMRLTERRGPDAVQMASRMESDGRVATERNLRVFYDRLKQRFPVDILDHELRITELPKIPDS